MHLQYNPPIASVRERPLLLIKQPIFYFLTTCTHVIYITKRQMRVLLLLAQIPVFTVTKIDTCNIVSVLADKNSRIAILYTNHRLEIRNANDIEKIRISYENIVFSEEDVKRGFPKIYFKDDAVFLLTMNRLEMLSMKEKERKAYTDIITDMHGKNNQIESVAFSSLIKDEKVAVLHFKNKLSFTFIPISITEIQTKHVSQIKMLSIAKFYDVDKYLPREYLVMIIDNTKLEVYNLVSMKKLIEIQYDTEIGSKIQLNSDYDENFLLVTIYRPGHQIIKTMFLYRINVQYYYPPTSDYFKEKQPFFDTSVELNIKHPIILLTRNYQNVYSKLLTDEQPYPKCPSVTAIYYREAQKKTIKKKFKQISSEALQKQKILEIVMIEIDISRAQPFEEQIKNKQVNFSVKRLKQEWMELREWKQMIQSYLEMKKSLEFYDNSDNQQQEKQGEIVDDDDFYLTDRNDKANSDNKTIKYQDGGISKKYENDPYNKLRKSLEDASQFLFEKECEDKDCTDQFLELHNKNKEKEKTKNQEKQLQKITNLEKTQLKKQINSFDEKYRPDTQPQTPKENQKITTKVIKEKNNIQSLPSAEQSYANQKKIIQHEDKDKSDSDPNQLFDDMLEAIEVSINRGFSPLQKKLASLEDKLDRYQQKQVVHLEKYSQSVQYECNYLNNIESSIHGYCFEMMGQFSETIQSGVQEYWQKIEDIDRSGQQERKRTIHEFGMFIDQQIKERQSIFDHHRMKTENSLGQLRKAISSQKQKIAQKKELEKKKDQKINPYLQQDEEDIEEMDIYALEIEETEDLKGSISYMEALAMLSSILGKKNTRH